MKQLFNALSPVHKLDLKMWINICS